MDALGDRPATALAHHKRRRVFRSHRMTRSHTGNCADEWRLHDRDRCADSDDVVQLDDVAGAHPYAAVAGRRTDSRFLRRAVDVNVSRKCVPILPFESTQPEDSRHYRIPTRRVRENNLASAPPVFEYRAGWGARTDLLRNLQTPEWCRPAARSIAETKLGRGDSIGSDQIAAIKKRKLLVARADDDFMLRVRRCTRREKDCKKQEVGVPRCGV